MAPQADDLGQIEYLYNTYIPNTYAATLQILKTGAAIAERGVGFRLNCGPVGISVTELANRLALRPSPKLSVRPVFPGDRVLGRPVPRRVRDAMLARGCRRLLERERPACVISRGETGIAAALAPRPPGTKLILEVHKLLCLDRLEKAASTMLPLERARDASGFARERAAFHAADGHLFISQGVRAAAEALYGIPSGPALVLPSGVEPPAAPRTRFPDTDFVFAGKIETRKGLWLMLRALERMPEASLRLIGTGPELVRARAFVAGIGAQDRIELTGARDHADLAAELARGRIGLCLLPGDIDHVAHSFSSPMKLLEFMALGLPVIATDMPTVREICGRSDAPTAVLCPPDPYEIAAAGAALLADAGRQARLGRAGRTRAEGFAWPNRGRRLLEFCQEVLAA
ncbi:MAG: glycosyltransferase [Pseudomonadota bacterium]